MKNPALYEITAERNNKKIILKFLDRKIACDAASDLRRQGFIVDYRAPDAYQIEQTLEQAIETAFQATS